MRWALWGLAIGGAFLAVALRGTDFHAVWKVLRTAQPGWYVLVLISGPAFIAFKTWRWALILRPLTRADFHVLHSIVYIGAAANLVISHTGEIARATLLGRREGLSPSAVLATVAIERILDFAAMLVMLGILLLTNEQSTIALASSGALGLLIVLAGTLVIVVALRPSPLVRDVVRASIQRLPERIRPWIARQLQGGVAGLIVLETPGALIGLAMLSFLQWAIIVAAMWCSIASVGGFVPLSAAIAIFVLSVVGLTLPAAPAQLGTVQAVFIVGLGTQSVDNDLAFAASLVYTGFFIMPVMIVGAVAWAVGYLGRKSTGGGSAQS